MDRAVAASQEVDEYEPEHEEVYYEDAQQQGRLCCATMCASRAMCWLFWSC